MLPSFLARIVIDSGLLSQECLERIYDDLGHYSGLKVNYSEHYSRADC